MGEEREGKGEKQRWARQERRGKRRHSRIRVWWETYYALD
jgi:hypothetical protein